MGGRGGGDGGGLVICSEEMAGAVGSFRELDSETTTSFVVDPAQKSSFHEKSVTRPVNAVGMLSEGMMVLPQMFRS